MIKFLINKVSKILNLYLKQHKLNLYLIVVCSKSIYDST